MSLRYLLEYFITELGKRILSSGGSRVAQALPSDVAPPFQSIPLQNQAMGMLASSLLKTNSSLEKWEKTGIWLSASLYVEIISVLTCTFPSPPLASTAPARVTGSFVCLNDLLFNKWVYIFIWESWITSKGALFLIEANGADGAGESWRRPHLLLS